MAIADIAEVLNVTPEMVKMYSLDRAEEALMVYVGTSTSTSTANDGNIRVTIMKAGSLTEKQLLYNSLRTIMVSGITAGGADETPSVAQTPAAKPQRRLSAREAVLLMKADSVKAAADAAIAAAEAENRGGSAAPAVHHPVHHHRRGSAVAGSHAQAAAHAATNQAGTSQETMKQRRTIIEASVDQEQAKMQELQNQLLLEQATHHKLVVQVKDETLFTLVFVYRHFGSCCL